MELQRRFVLANLGQFAGLRITALPDEAREKVNAVAYYLDALALLVEKGLVDSADIIQLLGGSIQRQYEALRPFIEREREERHEPIFMRGFEHLAALCTRRRGDEALEDPPEYAHLRRFVVSEP